MLLSMSQSFTEVRFVRELSHHPVHSRVDQLTTKEPTYNNQHHIPVTSINSVNGVNDANLNYYYDEFSISKLI